MAQELASTCLRAEQPLSNWLDGYLNGQQHYPTYHTLYFDLRLTQQCCIELQWLFGVVSFPVFGLFTSTMNAREMLGPPLLALA